MRNPFRRESFDPEEPESLSSRLESIRSEVTSTERERKQVADFKRAMEEYFPEREQLGILMEELDIEEKDDGPMGLMRIHPPVPRAFVEEALTDEATWLLSQDQKETLTYGLEHGMDLYVELDTVVGYDSRKENLIVPRKIMYDDENQRFVAEYGITADTIVENRSHLVERSRDFIRHLSDPHYLPSTKEIDDFFNVRGYLVDYRVSEIARQSLYDVLSQGEVNRNEVLTEDKVEAMSDYLVDLVDELGIPENKPLTIIEVGNIDGRFTHFTKQRMNSKLRERGIDPRTVNYLACTLAVSDDEVYKDFPIENMTHQEALTTYEPHVVIGSWLPPGEDWTENFRNTPSVEEYILLGPAGKDSTGLTFESWGIIEDAQRTPPYENDGFIKRDSNKKNSPEQKIAGASVIFQKAPQYSVASFRRMKNNG